MSDSKSSNWKILGIIAIVLISLLVLTFITNQPTSETITIKEHNETVTLAANEYHSVPVSADEPLELHWSAYGEDDCPTCAAYSVYILNKSEFRDFRELEQGEHTHPNNYTKRAAKHSYKLNGGTENLPGGEYHLVFTRTPRGYAEVYDMTLNITIRAETR